MLLLPQSVRAPSRLKQVPIPSEVVLRFRIRSPGSVRLACLAPIMWCSVWSDKSVATLPGLVLCVCVCHCKWPCDCSNQWANLFAGLLHWPNHISILAMLCLLSHSAAVCLFVSFRCSVPLFLFSCMSNCSLCTAVAPCLLLLCIASH